MNSSLAYVLNCHDEPLMPCRPRKARKLLEAGKARVVRRDPFTIKLLNYSGRCSQPIIAGMDIGSKALGVAAVANGRVLYQSEVKLRHNIKHRMTQRRQYRRTRRNRKTRYRKARWLNRASMRREGRLPPTIRSKVGAHLREKTFVESILPVTHWKVETAAFDIHKLVHPDVSGKEYQNGPLKGLYKSNSHTYALYRDGHKCQSGLKGEDVKHSPILNVHHIIFRSEGGTDAPDNLITLCEYCHHELLHKGKLGLVPSKMKKKARRNAAKTRHATQVSIIAATLRKRWNFEETFGYITKYKRQLMQLDKTHYNDAIAICCEIGEVVYPHPYVVFKVCVPKGEYKQTRGQHSETRMPTGKLFGLRKFDKIRTRRGVGFVQGKRRSGSFTLMDIFGNIICSGVSVKRDCDRIQAAKSVICETVRVDPKPGHAETTFLTKTYGVAGRTGTGPKPGHAETAFLTNGDPRRSIVGRKSQTRSRRNRFFDRRPRTLVHATHFSPEPGHAETAFLTYSGGRADGSTLVPDPGHAETAFLTGGSK